MSGIKIFEDKKVRSVYDGEKEIWYFSARCCRSIDR
jgi:hypothetical protein